jgi:hypothetical protein
VAAIAQAAGFPVSELDLWRASAAIPDELQPAPTAPASNATDRAPSVDLAPSSNPLAPAGDQAEAPRSAGPLPDPWLEDDPLSRFVHQAHGDGELRQALASAPDAAAVAAIAQAAGYPISEVDLWLASGATPQELATSHQRLAADNAPLVEAPTADAAPASDAAPAAEEPLSLEATPARQGEDRIGLREGAREGRDEGLEAWLQEGLAEGLREGLDEGASPGAMAPESPVSDLSLQDAAEDAIRRFLQQVEEDGELQQALTSAPDAAAVAAIAQAAGHPISELALWLASGAAFEEAVPEQEPASPAGDALGRFLRAVEVDPDLRIALASAPDAVTVAAIARIAGFPVTAADLWAASDADPHELVLEEVLVDDLEELLVEEMVLVVDG